MTNIKISIITSLYKSEKYLRTFLSYVSTIANLNECELILVHNDPSEVENQILEQFLNPSITVVHIKVKREPLYKSWNRAIKIARGRYLTIWNVDDVRLPESLQDQATALDSNKDAAIAYGDYTVVDKYGAQEGVYVSDPEYTSSNKSFLRKHHIGCFPMWRKEIHQNIGFFDEQFKLVGDLDFQIRVAKAYPLVKVNKLLGFFLAGTENLSSNYQIQDLEHTALHLRYGNFDLIYLTYLFDVLKNFKIAKYKWQDDYYAVGQWHKRSLRHFILNFPSIFVSVSKYPRHVARKYIRPIARKYLKYHIKSTVPNTQTQHSST